MKNKLYLDYILMQTMFFFLMGILCTYGSYALLGLGYNMSTVGVILSLGSLTSATLQPFAANISDNSKRFTLFNVCIFISILVVVLAALSVIKINSTILMLVIYVGLFGVYYALEPLINTVPAILGNNGIEIKFGVGRAAGSIGYAAANALLGILTGMYPHQVVFISALIVAIIILLINIKSNHDFLLIEQKTNKNEKKETISYIEVLKRHKSFVILMICTTGIYFSFTMLDNSMIKVVENVGGTSSDLGLIMAFKACLEVPVIFFYDKLEKRFSLKTLLKVAAISFVIKTGIVCFTKSVFMLYVDQILQMSSFSFMLPATVSYISNIMEPFEEARGQAVFVTCVTASQILSSLVSGLIIDNYSTMAMVRTSFVCIIISAIAYIITINKTK